MTTYRINHSFIFNEETQELKKAHSNASIKLTVMRANCLSYLIRHASDDIIVKGDISEELWGDRSKFTSDASLTQILYLIRRDLKALGIDDFFVTVPRVGVKVGSNMVIEIVEEKKRFSCKGGYFFLAGLITVFVLIYTIIILF